MIIFFWSESLWRQTVIFFLSFIFFPPIEMFAFSIPLEMISFASGFVVLHFSRKRNIWTKEGKEKKRNKFWIYEGFYSK